MKGMAFRHSHERELDHRAPSRSRPRRACPPARSALRHGHYAKEHPMLALVAALIFAIMAVFGLVDKRTGDIFTFNVLLSIGLCLLALHLSGGVGKWSRR
jgi:hypothetical protein